MTMILMHDFPTGKRIEMFISQEELSLVDENWKKSDVLLRDLQEVKQFHGRNRWCDLDPAHYRILIERNVRHVSRLSDEERIDEENIVVRSLNFLIAALVRCLEHRCDSTIDFLRLDRVTDSDICFTFQATLSMESLPEGRPGLSLVIDNTQPEDDK